MKSMLELKLTKKLHSMRTKIITVLGVVFSSFSVLAQPANDNCVTAQTVLIPASGSICFNSSNAGATSDLTTNSCDTGAPGNEVWYTYIVTGGANTVTITPNGATPASSVVVSLQNTPCGSGFLNVCNSGVGGAATTANFAYTIGTQVWFSVETNGTDGTYEVCVSSISQPAAPGNSCGTASRICTKNTFTLNPFPVNSNVITPSCFPSPFQQPIFYQFTVGQSGTCIWSADPIGAAEYDWVMYDITGGCPGTNVCCNFNYASGTGAPIGMQVGGAGACGTAGFAGAPGEFSPPANVVSGNTYLIVIDNYTNNTNGFVMSWGGTFEMAPNPSFTLSTTSGCTPLNVNITNTSTATVVYDWDYGNGNASATSANSTQTYTTPGSYIVSLVGTSASGCVNVETATITVNAAPIMNPVANQINCPGAIAATPFSANIAGTTFAWTNSNTSIGLAASGTGNLPAFAGANSGSTNQVATITVTPTAGGCAGTPVVFTITIKPRPTVDPVVSISQCAGSSIAATAFSSTPVGATFSWTNSNTAIGLGASGTAGTPVFTGTNASAVNIVGTITITPILNGCIGNTSNFTITITPAPTMAAPANITQCGGAVPAVNFVTIPAGGTTSWTNTNTSIGLGGSGSGNIASFAGTNGTGAPISGTISVTPSIGACVGSPVNFTITINPTPIISPIADITACFNTAVPAANFIVAPAATANWTNSNTAIGLGASGSGNIASFTGLNPGAAPLSGTITVNATASGCAAIPQIFTITITTGPTMNPVANVTQCANTIFPVAAYSSATAGVTYSWSNSNTTIGLGASGTGNTSSFNGLNASASAINSGVVTVTPAIGGCIGTPVNYTITVNPIPQLLASNNGPVCEGSPLNLSVVGPAGATYNWSGPNAFTAPVQNGTIANPTVAATGLYTVTATLNGCVGTTTTNSIVNPMQTPTINAAGPFCLNAPSQTLSASIAGGIWSGTGITNNVNGTFDPTTAGVGTQIIIYTLPGSCSNPATVNITINPLPTVAFSSPLTSGCVPFTLTLNDNSVPVSSSVLWNFGDGSTSSQIGSVNHTYNTVGCFDVTLTSTSAGGCTNSQTLIDFVCSEAYADASFNVLDPTASILNPTFDFINNSTNATNYSWTFGDGTGTGEEDPTHVYPPESGSFLVTLIANNADNCSDTASLVVTIKEELIYYVPNSFTPDGDEYNNEFKPIFFSGFDPQNYQLIIYNRWGETLFESKNNEIGWDGTYLGEYCENGTYVWTIKFKDSGNDKKYSINGHITLLK